MKQNPGGGGPFEYNSFFNQGSFHNTHFKFHFDDFFGDDWKFEDDDSDDFFGGFFGGGHHRPMHGKLITNSSACDHS